MSDHILGRGKSLVSLQFDSLQEQQALSPPLTFILFPVSTATAMPVAGFKKLTDEEMRLAKKWYKEDKCQPSEIADRLSRDKSTITRLLVKQVVRKKQGRPAALTTTEVDFLVKRLDAMVEKAKARYHVTVSMLKKTTRCRASGRIIKDALHRRNIYFRKLREKPLLTEEDIAARKAFALKYKGKSSKWWNQNMHAIIDGKHFQVYLNGKERDRAAQHATWGAYRTPGQGLNGAYVKPKKSLKHNTGAASTLVMAGVGRGKVLMWYNVPSAKWSGAAAAVMYSRPLPTALEKTWPGKRSWQVLEDNDPTGFKSKKGLAAKAANKISIFPIPKRSPDLNVCDYALWKEINKRMRLQEKRWSSKKRETRPQYMARLRRTAMRLPRRFIGKSVGDMRRRCQRLHEAKGGFFEEGGK
jgi:hypothetical protein